MSLQIIRTYCEALFHIGHTRQVSLLEEHIDALADDELNPAELVEEPVIV